VGEIHHIELAAVVCRRRLSNIPRAERRRISKGLANTALGTATSRLHAAQEGDEELEVG
jgi:hypothetical protein